MFVCVCVTSFLRQLVLNITHWLFTELFLALKKNTNPCPPNKKHTFLQLANYDV